MRFTLCKQPKIDIIVFPTIQYKLTAIFTGITVNVSIIKDVSGSLILKDNTKRIKP